MKCYQYINSPTKQLMDAIGQHVADHCDLSQHPKVIQALESLQRVSEEVPSFVHFIDDYIRFSSNQAGFGQREITLIEMYLIMRVLSTYMTIPVLVGHLHLIGEYEAAARINSNAIDESGGKGNPSHHELLVNSLNIAAKSIGGLPVTTKRLLAAIQIYELRNTASKIGDSEVLWARLKNDSQYLSIQKEELPLVIKIAELLDGNMLRYHRHIHKTLLIPTMLEPSNKQILALATLELAKREAESVDEKEANLSFIGTWERLIRFYGSRFHPDEYKMANAWAAAHNDGEEAKKGGWVDRSAEDGHARDARCIALQVLEQVTENAVLRLQHWDYLVTSLNKG